MEDKKRSAPHSLELVSIGKTNKEMVEIQIKEGRKVTGKSIRDLDLPENTLVTAVIRGEKLITPRGNTTIQAEDILYVLLSKDQREKVKQAFALNNDLPNEPEKNGEREQV